MTDPSKPVARPGETLVHLHFINPDTNDRSTWIGTSAHRALLRDADGRLNLEVMIDVDGQPAPATATEADGSSVTAAQRLAALEQRHERIWDLVLELRQKATARNLDPYLDPTAQALSAILTGDTGWRITYGTLIETRDDLDTAKARAVELWERTKWEADEFETEWQPDVARGDGALALVGIEEDGTGFFTGVVISPLTVEPPAEQHPAVLDPADGDAPSCRDCGTWPCARHATNEDRAEYQQATGAGYRAGDFVEIHDRDETYNGMTGVVVQIDEGDGEFPIGLDVEGFLGLVWCNPSEIRHVEPATAESGAAS